MKFIEAALAGAKAEDDITTAVAAKKQGTAEVENRCFILINAWKTKW
ncbi:hypothetical protein [Nostoc sp.]